MEVNRITELEKAFARKFGTSPAHVIRAPGRVNLIGEHTDYNDGWVLPMAIDRDVLIAARARNDQRVHMCALDRGGADSEFALDNIGIDESKRWSNYVRGVAALLRQRGFTFPGLDLMIVGNVPIGSGLSSSAALLVAAAVTFQTFGQFALDRVALAQLCQQAENDFCNVKTGIMDQFISALAVHDSALLIDCRQLSYEHVPLPRDCAVLVCDTMKRRALSNSEYNKRRGECEQATRWLSEKLGRPFHALRDVAFADFERVEREMPSVLAKRARHVLCENARVHRAVDAARRNDAETFGALMNESHTSLRDYYQVSSDELDLLVGLAREQKGVLGARLTGAGFGGCTVKLVRTAFAQPAADAIARAYRKQTGIQAQTFIVKASDGARSIY